MFIQLFDPTTWRRRTIPVIGIYYLPQTPPKQAPLDNKQEEE